MTASQRAMKARNQDFYSEKGKLFCKFCCKIVDHSRQSSLDKHRQTESHIANKRQPQRQKSITTAFLIPNEARLENVKLITDWVKMCAGANIPFVATDNSTVRNFFKEHVVSGGAIPKSRALTPYLEDCYSAEKQRLKTYLEKKKVALFYDETFDSRGRFVSCILVAVMPPDQLSINPILAETLDEYKPLTAEKVAEHITDFLNDYKISKQNVVGYATDNAKYMLSSYTFCLKALLPKSPHLTCISHILNLVVKDYLGEFSTSVSWCTKFSGYFSKSGGRKYRYQQFLTDIGAPIKLAPQAIKTRWTSTFDAILYHHEYLRHEKAFLAIEAIDDDETDIFLFLNKNFKILQVENSLLKLRVMPLINALKVFESDLGFGCLMDEYLELLSAEIDLHCTLLEDSLGEIFSEFTETFSTEEKRDLLNKLQAAGQKARIKFSKYFDPEKGVHPAKVFLKEIRFFNPRTSLAFDTHPTLCAIPDISEVPGGEYILYRRLARQYTAPEFDQDTDVLKQLKTEIQAIRDFWTANSRLLPTLAKIAWTYSFIICSSASVERTFSYFNNLYENDRERLEPATVKKLLFLYFNATRF